MYKPAISTQTGAGELGVQGQLGLYEIMLQNKKPKTNQNNEVDC